MLVTVRFPDSCGLLVVRVIFPLLSKTSCLNLKHRQYVYCKYFSCVMYSSQSKIPVWPFRPRTFPNGRKTSNRVYFGVKNILDVGTLKPSTSELYCRTVRICSLSHAFIFSIIPHRVLLDIAHNFEYWEINFEDRSRLGRKQNGSRHINF